MPPSGSSTAQDGRRTTDSFPDAAFQHAGTSLAPTSILASDDSAGGIAARIPRLRDPNDPLKLTPLRAHYLKKTLVSLQIEQEIKSLSQKDALATFGPPFHPSPTVSRADVPILRFLFHHFLLTFPFLRSAPPNFWGDKVQLFVTRFLERNISGTTPDESEVSKRKRVGTKMGKWITLLMGSAIHVVGPPGNEEVLSIAPEDRERMVAAQERMRAALAGAPPPDTGFDVNVVGVRPVRTKPSRLARAKVHDEFIIRTRRTGQPDVFVSRRYGDFARLADTLRVEFPSEDVGRPPNKDRRGMQFAPGVWNESAELEADEDAQQLNMGQLDLNGNPQLPERQRTLSTGANAASRSAAQYAASQGTRDDSQVSTPRAAAPPRSNAAPLAREKNRLTLRAYLRSLLAIPSVADSASLSSFLLEDSTELTRAEQEDVAAREALDAVREDEAGRFATEASRRVSELREHITEFKASLVQRDGLSQVFGTIKRTPNIEDLPESYRALLAWGRISAASTLFHLFMGADTASDLFAQLKRIHGLMPYFMLRGILRISNPVYMVRSVLDLFLAQPFGQRSLLQRMFTQSMQEEVKEIEAMLAGVRIKVDDDDLCERVARFVNAPVEVQRAMKAQAKQERLDILTVILRTPPEGMQPLAKAQVHRVVRASRAYEVYKEYRTNLRRGEEDEGPGAVDAEAWLYEDLHVYKRCQTRLRDKQQMISLIFEGVTSELLKDIVTIFYSPLAQVYKAANIADSLSDLQAFITDLIRTVESSEELSYTDPQRTVQVFIDLVQRHEGRFYHFVHEVHSKGSGLFDGLMHWIELFINFVRGPDEAPDTPSAIGPSSQRRGIGAVDLEVCMPAGGAERRAALAEIDALVVYAYRIKMVRELKLRRRLANKEVESAASKLMGRDGAPSAGGTSLIDDDQAFVAAMVDNLGVGDAFTEEMEDVEAEAELDAEDSDDSDDEQAFHDAPAYREESDDIVTSESDTDAGSSTHGSEDHSRLNSNAAAAAIRGWRPPPPGRSVSQLTARPSDTKELPPIPPPSAQRADDDAPRRPRKPRPPRAPELTVIPDMVPLFIEMVRPMLRPARTASASSVSSAPSPKGPGPSAPFQLDTSAPGLAAARANAATLPVASPASYEPRRPSRAPPGPPGK